LFFAYGRCCLLLLIAVVVSLAADAARSSSADAPALFSSDAAMLLAVAQLCRARKIYARVATPCQIFDAAARLLLLMPLAMIARRLRAFMRVCGVRV